MFNYIYIQNVNFHFHVVKYINVWWKIEHVKTEEVMSVLNPVQYIFLSFQNVNLKLASVQLCFEFMQWTSIIKTFL